jgi:16S rRNA C967 or C1407 C5-methylase (RsmB/RsmF family)/NOL1/NOP2/fmu family ribosome biogenesis protein
LHPILNTTMQLPRDFVTLTGQLLGDNGIKQLTEAIAEEAIVSIRLNPNKWPFKNQKLKNEDGCVTWCDNGFYLKNRPSFTFDPLMHAGCYYVQEASSMFLAQVIKQYINVPCKMLDLCAAPGGKSTVARSMLTDESLLVSNEPIHNRAQILAENMMKFGHPYTIVTNNYPKDFKQCHTLFDVILTDVPCSGEGMFRKDKTAISEWSLQNVENCWKRQREIVNDIWRCLKPGGILIYSTCTFNTKENEENIKWICEELGANVLPVSINDNWNVTGSLLDDFDKPVYRFLPGKTRGEGLFLAVLRKDGDTQQTETYISKSSKYKIQKQETNIKQCWIKESENFEFSIKNNIITAFPKTFYNFYSSAIKELKVVSAGIKIGEIKGNDIIPGESLALSLALNKDMFPNFELTYKQAIAFLHKEAITLPAHTPHGFVLLTFKGMPLGFEKNIGNRANNLYPQEWRIKSGHIPEENQCIIE